MNKTKVALSSADCAKLNAANREAIELGLTAEVAPNDAMLAQEAREQQEGKDHADWNAKAKLFLDKVVSILPESVRADLQSYVSERTRNTNIKFTKCPESQVEVEVYSAGFYSSSPKTLRAVVGWCNRKSIFKVKNNSIADLATDEELAKKVATAMMERYAAYQRVQADLAAKDAAYKQKQAIYEANKELFSSMRIYSSDIRGNEDGVITAPISFSGTIEQWKALQTFLISHK